MIYLPEVQWCLAKLGTWLGKRRRPRWRSARGQAVMEYMILLIMMGMLAALIYRFISPRIEKLIVNMAKDWIAGNIAGE
ncbi:MAG: hypothetical protein LAO31_14510 [Acidobacteriia bacterium]|nr:hypothetical protein [Terriglobia bacterium]